MTRAKPPRALRVPFELGRAFGPPNDPAFHKQVILAALRLLERTDGSDSSPNPARDFVVADFAAPADRFGA